MKTFKTLPTLAFCIGLLISSTSCTVLVENDTKPGWGWHYKKTAPPAQRYHRPPKPPKEPKTHHPGNGHNPRNKKNHKK